MRRRTLLQSGVIDLSNATVTPSSSYTYDGTAKTPSVTVTLLGETISSQYYDVTYSNNINAGTATVTVTGKDGYEGTATGTFTISKKSLSITASDQTVTYPSTISSSTSKVSVSGLVSGDSLTSILLSSSISAPGTGTITPSDAYTSKGISNYSVTYYTGTVTIYKGSGTVSFGTSTCYFDYNPGNTGTIWVNAATNCGWVKTSDKSVSGYNVYKSVSNYHVANSYSVMKLSIHVSGSTTITFKVGPATESSFDYVYITQVDAADVTSNDEPSNPLYSGETITAEWTNVSVTIPSGTHTIQIVYRKDSSVNNSPDCGYVAIPDTYEVNFTSIQKNQPSYIGSGNFTWSSSNTSVATINNSTGAVTIAGEGTTTITASMAEDSYYYGASSTYTISVSQSIQIGAVLNFSYTGSYQTQKLTPGTYRLQVWGAQGGSNAAYSTYGITAQAGGKGGYSDGNVTISSNTTVRVYVGGQGSSSGSGGYNGGGSTPGTSSHNADNELGYSKMGGGGGATDIRLSDGSLYSRMIVAGGGSGGAVCYRAITTTTPTTTTWSSSSFSDNYNGYLSTSDSKWHVSTVNLSDFESVSSYRGQSCTITPSSNSTNYAFTTSLPPSSGSAMSFASGYSKAVTISSSTTVTVPSNASYLWVSTNYRSTDKRPTSVVFTGSSSSTSTSIESQVGYVGGGVNGDGYVGNRTYYGTQSSPGYNASFGEGSGIDSSTIRYCSAGGGGGWYGGGSHKSDDKISYYRNSGGGSGWVNTSSSSSNRPSGFSSLQLDSGTTYAGNTSFVAPGGGSETGHSGNGYARITRTG